MWSPTCIILLSTLIYSIFIIIWLYSNSQLDTVDNGVKLLDIHKVKFHEYMKRFDKTYEGDEYEKRLLNFKASLLEIKRLNALEEAEVFGLTRFSDMSKKELADQFGLNQSFGDLLNPHGKTYPIARGARNNYTKILADVPLPDKVDWREDGYVSPVLDQKMCMACWAFSIIGVMETMAVKRGHPREMLSKQELLDCSPDTEGCKGGHIRFGLEYLYDKHVPITTEEEYPLTLGMDKCRPQNSGIILAEFHIVSHINNEEEILRKITQGPVITVVYAREWVAYTGGIIRRACYKNSNETYVHAVQIVGYDKTGVIPYYIIRNSWGTDWGNNGYVYVKIGDNVCDVASQIGSLDVYPPN